MVDGKPCLQEDSSHILATDSLLRNWI